MAYRTFDYPVKYDFTISTTPEIYDVGFGDGYEQSAPKGLNHIMDSHSLTYTGARHDIDDAEKFLREQGGYKAFYWYSPRLYRSILVKCKTWNQQGDGHNATLTMTFQEVVA